MREKVLAYIREHELLKAGDRVGLAVSGGADSVGLLRLLLELRDELGLVFSVLHFNHKIRGADADRDESFVRSLAAEHCLECCCSSVDVPAYAAEHRLSLESAGRKARYDFFESILRQQNTTVVATGHTMDDQAETVLMRLLRGAGTRGLAGIYPQRTSNCGAGHIVRPLLETRRTEIRLYLDSLHQTWREDATNVDLQYTRNRIRHGLIPLIETRFQPSVVPVLAQLADVAREEENYWEAETQRAMLATVGECSSHELAVSIPKLLDFSPALQRRIIRHSAQRLGISVDFEHLKLLLELARRHEGGHRCELRGGWCAVIEQGELRFERRVSLEATQLGYEYSLPIPGEVEIQQIGRVIRAFLRPAKCGLSGYNPEQSLDAKALGRELTVRNWRPGDHFWPSHSKRAKKLKELFQERHVPLAQRRCWPVAVIDGKLAWARGFGPSAEFQPSSDAKQVVVIEEHVLHPHREH